MLHEQNVEFYNINPDGMYRNCCVLKHNNEQWPHDESTART